MINTLLERISLTKEDVHGMINDALKKKAAQSISIKIPASLQKKIIEGGKEEDFNTFVNNLPGGNSTAAMTSFLNQLSAKEQSEFVRILYSKDSISNITSGDYSSGIGSKLYDLEPKGIGKAELLLATLIRNSKVSGGGESFDLAIGNKKYEVKDYRSYSKSKPIRLGTKGKVTKFEFWNEINKTLNVVNDLVVTNGIKFIQDDNLKTLILDINSRIDMISKGEFNKDDIKKFKQLYISFNKLSQSNSTGYTYVTFRGPNASPVSYMIDEIPTNLKKNISLNLKERGISESLIIELRRLKYVRNPNEFTTDIQEAVNSIVGSEIPYIVFRPDGPKITTEFEFSVISQGGIYIKEKE
jgi:hypothetical protein